jgi:lipopolysaccharide transport system ATP-binding protein
MSFKDIAVSVRQLSKVYQIAHNDQRPTTLGEAFLQRVKKPLQNTSIEQFWALKDVSFDIEQGDVVGIIGRNGAGKSTLLKILSQITEPTAGEIDMYGRVGSLLEVGTGFHAELTGRENIYLNGAILGMRRREVEQNFDAIVDFAGVEQFLDTPVKRYSSGMYVRLAFAVAAHLNSEILIVDEVLAVGDTEFQAKCLGKMKDLAGNGRTVLFVSHNMGVVKNLCKSAILLSQGRLVNKNTTDIVMRDYLTIHGNSSGLWVRESSDNTKSNAFLTRMEIIDGHGIVTGNVDSDQSFHIDLHICALQEIPTIQIAIRVQNGEGICIFTTANSDAANAYPVLAKGESRYSVEIPSGFLPPGSYSLTAAIMIPNVQIYDLIEDELTFYVENTGQAGFSQDGRIGVVNPILKWNLTEK